MANLTKRAPLPTGEDLTAVVQADGVTVVATSEAKVLVSSDLEVFEPIPTGVESGFTDLVHLGSNWFASGDHVYRSIDLTSWEVVLAAENDEVVFQHVFAAGDFLFATSTEKCFPAINIEPPKLFRSADAGETWDVVTGAPPATCFRDLIFAKGKYFLAGTGRPLGNGLWDSEDGVVWKPILPGAYTFFKLREFDDEIFALNSDGEVSISGDGIQWEIVKPERGFSPQFTRSMIDIIKLPTHFLMYAEWDSYDLMWKSGDGRAWEWIPPTTPTYFPHFVTAGLEAVDGVALAYGGDGVLFKASDWEIDLEQALPSYYKDWNAVAASNSSVVVVGDGGQVGSSSDTVTWRFQLLEPEFDLGGVTFDHTLGTWFAVGRAVNGTGKIFSSPDGEIWVDQLTTAEGLRGVGSDRAGRVVVCGDGGKLLTIEGGGWRDLNAGTSEDLYAIEFCGMGWLAVGDRYTILRSESGVDSWGIIQTNPLATSKFVSIDCANGIVVVGFSRQYEGGIRDRIVSEDLECWHSLGASDPGAVAFDGVRLVSAVDGISVQPGLWHQFYPDPIGIYWRWSMIDGVKFRDRIVFVGDQGRIAVSDLYADELTSWLEQRLQDPGQRQSHADPDQDGFSNALEYCLGFDPLEFNSVSEAIEIRKQGIGGLEHPNAVAAFPGTTAVDAAVVVEWSSDLSDWHRVGGAFARYRGNNFPDGVTGVELSLPGPSNEIYFRLKCKVVDPR